MDTFAGSSSFFLNSLELGDPVTDRVARVMPHYLAWRQWWLSRPRPFRGRGHFGGNPETLSGLGEFFSDGLTLGLDQGMRAFRLPVASGVRGGTLSVPIILDANGNEVAWMFSLHYHTAALSNPRVTSGPDAGGFVLTVNDLHVGSGKLVILQDTDPRTPIAAGSRHIATVTFDVAANASPGVYGINFAGTPRPLSTSDGMGLGIPAMYQNGHAVVLAGVNDSVSNYSVPALHVEPLGYEGSRTTAETPGGVDGDPGQNGGGVPIGGNGPLYPQYGDPTAASGQQSAVSGQTTGTPDNTIFGFSPIVVIGAAAAALFIFSSSK